MVSQIRSRIEYLILTLTILMLLLHSDSTHDLILTGFNAIY